MCEYYGGAKKGASHRFRWSLGEENFGPEMLAIHIPAVASSFAREKVGLIQPRSD